MRPRHRELVAVGALAAAVLRLNAADPTPSLPQAEDSTCRGKWEDLDPRTRDCKRDWIFDHCTTFAIEHEAAFEAIKDCTLEAELLTDYCAAPPPGVNRKVAPFGNLNDQRRCHRCSSHAEVPRTL